MKTVHSFQWRAWVRDGEFVFKMPRRVSHSTWYDFLKACHKSWTQNIIALVSSKLQTNRTAEQGTKNIQTRVWFKKPQLSKRLNLGYNQSTPVKETKTNHFPRSERRRQTVSAWSGIHFFAWIDNGYRIPFQITNSGYTQSKRIVLEYIPGYYYDILEYFSVGWKNLKTRTYGKY